MWTCSLGHVPKSRTAGSCCNSFLITLHIKVMFRTQIQCYFHSVPIVLPLGSTSVLCLLTSWPQSAAIPIWLFSSHCEWLGSRDRHSCFWYSRDTEYTALHTVGTYRWRVLILHDQTYKIDLILNVHFKMLTIKCWANNT